MNAVVDYGSAVPTESLRDKARAYWRRRGTFLATFAVCFALGVALALLLPPTYKSQAVILIEQQEIPQELVRSAITSFADQRIQVISQRVMTTQNLLTLIDRYHLYPDMRLSKPREELMARMREDVSMKTISADVIDPRNGHPTQATIAFSVGYQNVSADTALKVANDLTTLYLNENLTSRTQSAQETSAFFDEQANREQAKIAELDKSLSDFKEKHRDRLPELQQMNVQGSDRTEMALRDVENRISALDSQIIVLQAQLAQLSPTALVFSDTGQRIIGPEDRLKELKTRLASLRARYSPDHPDVIAAEREVAGLQKDVKSQDTASDLARQLQDARTQLARASEKYTPEHPDVVRLQRQVAELEKQVAAHPAADERPNAEVHADNPAYLQVRGEVDSLMAERKADEMKRSELQSKLDEYERRLAGEPLVEKDYRALARELENAQLKYQQIRAKQSDVQVSENLESERKGERFTLIEPPMPPEKPISPNRVLIVIMSLVLSVALALGVVFLTESFDSSVRGVDDVHRLLNVPPLASIPMIVTRRDRRRKLMARGFVMTGVLVMFIGAGAAVHFWYRPLDVLWSGVERRFGM